MLARWPLWGIAVRFVSRESVGPPPEFGEGGAVADRERLLRLFSLDEEELSQTRFEPTWDPTGSPRILLALRELFRQRCAFCEKEHSDLQMGRFRPSGAAEPVFDEALGHLYYVWLHAAWQNLYPICPGCRPRDPNLFPIIGRRRAPLPRLADLGEFVARQDGIWPSHPPDEKAALLDPCADQHIHRHLRFDPAGFVLPAGKSSRGAATIEHFVLNRRDLVQQRRRQFELNYDGLMEALDGIDGDVLHVPGDGLEFEGAWRICLRHVLASALGIKPSDDVRGRMERLSRHGDWRRRLTRAWQGAHLTDADVGRGAVAERVPLAPVAVSIRNFKSLEHLDLRLPTIGERSDGAAGALLVLGENASGKSTVLEALALALVPSGVRARLGVLADELVLDPILMGAGAARARTRGSVVIDYGERQRTLTIKPERDAAKEKPTEDVDDGFADDGPKTSLPVFAYGAFRQYLDAVPRHRPEGHVRNLFRSDMALPNPQLWLLGLPPQRFAMVARALRYVLGVGEAVDVLRRGKDARGEDAVFVVTHSDAGHIQETPLKIVSSGFRTVLAMVCDVMRGLMHRKVNPGFEALETATGIVLVDEIEAHLHPRWKMGIISGLRRALPRVIFVFTSHDPLCLRGMSDGEVVVLERVEGREAGSRLPVVTQAITDLPDPALWRIEQLLTADFFQLRTTFGLEDERRLEELERQLALGVDPAADDTVRSYLTELTSSLPIGDRDAERLVQEALARYLASRREETAAGLRELREETRADIVAALRGQPRAAGVAL